MMHIMEEYSYPFSPFLHSPIYILTPAKIMYFFLFVAMLLLMGALFNIHNGSVSNFFPVLFCSVLFCSVLFCSVLFCSVLFCSVLFCSVLFCSVR